MPVRAGSFRAHLVEPAGLPGFDRTRPSLKPVVEHGSKPYPAVKARGGEIILNTPARRAIFVAGLVGTIVVAFILMIGR